jgi:hypothetical protein
LQHQEIKKICPKINIPGKETLPGAILHYSAGQNPLSRAVNFSKISQEAHKKVKQKVKKLIGKFYFPHL